MNKVQFRFYSSVFIISGLVMALQIMQSRILSVTSWYHLSFLVISMAMFGLTMGALKIYQGEETDQRKNLSIIARYHTVLFSLFVLIGLICQLYIPIISSDLKLTLLSLPIAAVATSAAYYHAGIVITLCLTRAPYSSGLVYGVDLIGAAAGCLIALGLMETIDTPSGILCLATMGFVCAFIFPASKNKNLIIEKKPYSIKHISLIAGIASILAMIVNIGLPAPFLYPLWVKDKKLSMSEIQHEEWNSISRVTVLNEVKNSAPFLWGPSPVKIPENMSPDRSMLIIDGDAGTPITQFDGDLKKHGYLEYDVINLAYTIPGIKASAIIGVGGGRDLLSAKYFGVERVTALDVNPVQVRLLRDDPEFREYAGLYKLPGVKILNEEARSWFRRNHDKFDLIGMNLIDTWAATGAGAFALSENGLYTAEAWNIFMDDLSESGVFTVSRWSADTLNDTGRLFSLAMATLFMQDIKDAQKHIVLAHADKIVTLILSKKPFTSSGLSAIRKRAQEKEFEIVVAPDQSPPKGLIADLLSAHDTKELNEISAKQYFDVSPPTDMRPFFFNQARITKPLEILKMSMVHSRFSGVALGQAKATLNLFIIIVFSFLMVGFVIIQPLLRTIENKMSPFILAGTLYFFLIGLGFMLIEISMLQALGVFLGHPVYGLGVLLFSLILSAGAGSLFSSIAPLRALPSQILWCFAVCAYVVTLAFLIRDIFTYYAEAEIMIRILVSIAIIAPAGILMGFGFPTGLAITTKFNSRATAWFWGINGAAGVLGSSLAVASNIAFGIDKTLIAGGLCYAVLSVAFITIKKCKTA